MGSILSFNTLICLFVFAAPASAQDARAVLDRAIRAHGGEARLERTKKGHLKAEMESRVRGRVTKATWEETFDLPDRYRRSMEGTENGKPFHQEFAVIGRQGWYREGRRPPRRRLAEPSPLEQHWHAMLLQLLRLRDQDIPLASLPDEIKDGRTLAGIQARFTQGELQFFFDRSTGLLARARQFLPDLVGGSKKIGEILFDDYHAIQGIHYPMRWKFSSGADDSGTIVFSSLEFLDTIEDNEFAMPQTPAEEEPAPEVAAETTSSGASRASGAEPPADWQRRLIVATVGTCMAVGVVWLIVRASKRGKQETPPS